MITLWWLLFDGGRGAIVHEMMATDRQPQKGRQAGRQALGNGALGYDISPAGSDAFLSNILFFLVYSNLNLKLFMILNKLQLIVHTLSILASLLIINDRLDPTSNGWTFSP